MNTQAAAGFAFLCTPEGEIIEVFRDDFNLFADPTQNYHLIDIVDVDSKEKVMNFIKEILENERAFHWEINTCLKDELKIVNLNGVSTKGVIIIVGMQTTDEIELFLSELTKINSEQINYLHEVITERSFSFNRQRTHNIETINELSQLNNELTNLQRELRKKNTELQRVYQQMQKIAVTDKLTDVYNRWGFFNLAETEFERAKRYNINLSLLMLDLDHFKKVNDTYGHLIGDLVLKKTAERCKKILRTSDLLGRTGGEEFLILLPETTKENAYQLAERLRKTINEPIEDEEVTLSVSTSIGISTLDKECTSLDSMIQKADNALYEAKEQGRNRICIN